MRETGPKNLTNEAFGLQRTPTQTHDKHAPCPVPTNKDTGTGHKDSKPRHIRCKTARNDPNSGKAHADVRPTHKRRVGGRARPDLKEAPSSKRRHQSTLRSGDPCSMQRPPLTLAVVLGIPEHPRQCLQQGNGAETPPLPNPTMDSGFPPVLRRGHDE
jgi:hypothetical protein